MSLIELMISLKNDLDDGSSSSSKIFASLSHSAALRMSHSLIVPRLLLYMNRLHDLGWNSADVITSVSSSMLAGLMSTMLNDWSLIDRFHRLMRRSSLLTNVSPSLFSAIELMWYACAFENTRRGAAATTVCFVCSRGTTRPPPGVGLLVPLAPVAPPPSPDDDVLDAAPAAPPVSVVATCFTFFSNTFHSFTVLSLVVSRKRAAFWRLHQRILLIFSSISSDFR
mmetsp:Transcript_25851/g.62797  ORF Transcript_25851/g.62797 Transcript_25851/m.62797 type:complete len:225 (-) Transcript_25851:333-1007(-)